MSRRKEDAGRGSIEHDSRANMWPGITRGFDARCDGCTWALKDGVYQIKLRSQFCPNHGGQLESVLARWARAGHNISAAAIQGGAVLLLLASLAGLAGCGSLSCPKGQSWQVVSQYWVPSLYTPGHDVEEQIYEGSRTGYVEEEIWEPGFWVYGHWSYIWACR